MGKSARMFLVVALVWLAAFAPVLAGPDSPDAAMAGFDLSKGPIQIKADTLIASQTENMANFKGNVVATQEKTVIKSDSLKIWYTPAPEAKTEQGALPSTQELERIEATGNVTITNESFSSLSDKAVYTQKDGNLVLTGNQAEVVSGKNKVKGTKITRSRDGLLTFEGGVVAEFFPEKSEKGTDNAAQKGE